MSRPNPIREPLLVYVTDRKALSASPEKARELLSEKIEAAARAGVSWIQIREKDLSGRELAELTSEALRCVPESCCVFLNDRLDIAIAIGAGGVQLQERSIPVGEAKRLVQERAVAEGFQIGVSTHSLEAARAAEEEGADFILFGPVFATPSKAVYGPPQGIERVEAVCRSVSVPVLAIGGITRENARSCFVAGAKGVAAIRLFQDETNLPQLVTALRTLR